MALRGAAGRRYAQAVFDIAKESNALDRWLGDLKLFAGIFGTPNAVATLNDPRLTEVAQKRIVTEHIANYKVEPMAINLLMLLVERGRIDLLPRIAERFQELYNTEKGIIIADVTTAVPLDEAHKQRLAQQLSRLTGKTVQMRLHDDPRILGGMITRIGDELIDASIATRLATLAERIA